MSSPNKHSPRLVLNHPILLQNGWVTHDCKEYNLAPWRSQPNQQTSNNYYAPILCGLGPAIGKYVSCCAADKSGSITQTRSGANWIFYTFAFYGLCRRNALRFQSVVATHWLNLSAGVSYSRVFLGRSLRDLATAFNLAWLWTDKSVPLGKYWRSSRLVFSLEPLCHGLCGSQKNTSILVFSVKRLWSASSLPLSHVRDL